jgi:hypothetical protein
MAISHTIDTSDPDGATKTVSYLDDSARQFKVDVQERMEDSLIDTSIAGWNNTTTKELIEGLARIFTDTRAAKSGLARLKDGKVWVGTDADNTNAHEYYNGATWVAVPIGTANLLADAVTAAKIVADAVTTAKILDLNVTTGKLAASAVSVVPAEVTSSTDIGVTGVGFLFPTATPFTGSAGTSLLRLTITPASTASVFVFIFQGYFGLVQGGAATETGFVRIRNSTAGSTVTQGKTINQGQITNANTGERQWVTLVGFVTGVAVAATNFDVELAGSHANAIIHLRNDEQACRFMAIELKK